MRRGALWLPIIVGLLFCSGGLYYAHYAIFRDAHHIFIYLLGDVAFVPVEVLLVALVLERLLARHEKRALLNKLNMVIGAFFSELGTRLLGELTPAVAGWEQVRGRLAVSAQWTRRDFRRAISFARGFRWQVDASRISLEPLRDLLVRKREFMLRLLENPNLLEHERFTDLLWAVFHLTEELEARGSLRELPEADRLHLQGDMERVYSQLCGEWLAYAQHLQADYPFLFSLLVRIHPLQAHPSAQVR